MSCQAHTIEINHLGTAPHICVWCGSCCKIIVTSEEDADDPIGWLVIDYLVVKKAVDRHIRKSRLGVFKRVLYRLNIMATTQDLPPNY